MKEFLKKYQTLLFRVAGAMMLVVGFVVFFWSTPQKAFSENEIAARNVARMEARIAGNTKVVTQVVKPKHSPIMKAYKDVQAKQMRYALIILMILGVGFLGYSFVKKEED